MTKPLISVIVPVYEGERYLRNALESVLRQDYSPLEVIVVDDGSTDGSAAIARSFPEVRYIRQENQGPAAARNLGMSLARGELLGFLDADDEMLPGKLARQADYLEGRAGVGCVLTRQRIRLEEGIEPPAWLEPDAVFGDPGGVPPLSCLVRRIAAGAVGGFDASLRVGEGLEFLGRLQEAGILIEVLPEVLLMRRVHGSNLTHRNRALVDGLLRGLKGKLDRKRRARDGEETKAAPPLISVIMTVYDGERYLAEAIESVYSQSYPRLELVVVDDGSEDGSAEICRRYASLRYERQERGGMGAARNRAVALSTGELLAFLDADDVYEPGRLERQAAALTASPELEAVFGHVREFLSPELDVGAGADASAGRASAGGRLRAPMPRVPGHFPGAMLIRRGAFDRVGPFTVGLKVGNGLDWYARAREKKLRFLMLDDIVLGRRLHAGNNGLREREALAQYAHVLKASLDRRRRAAADSASGEPA